MVGVDVNTWINIVLVIATIAVVWFAWRAGKESRKATEAARATVTAVAQLLEVARSTAASSEAAAGAAAQTVEAAGDLLAATRAPHQADERDRLARQLRDLGQLAESAFFKAAAEDGGQPIGGWRCVEQQYVAVALKGIGLELPQCQNLAGASQAFSVKGYAVNARDEIAAELGIR